MKTQTTKRNPITKHQLQIIKLIYRFRFVTTKHLSLVLDKDIPVIQKRLNLLLAKGYVDRHYTSQDIRNNEFASYYLLPEGLTVLKRHDDKVSNLVVRRIYRDRKAKPQFIRSCLLLADTYCEFRTKYGDTLRFFTNSELIGYNYLKQLQPSAYAVLVNQRNAKHNPKHWLVEIVDSSKDRWQIKGRVRQYMQYAESEIWEKQTDTKLPKILLVCESESLQNKVQRIVDQQVEENYMVDINIIVNYKASIDEK